jgi:glycerophosphoryl diester phosphodiesterase
VRAIAAGGGTVWVATGGGLSAIHRKRMTLAEKADHYLKICLARHVRAPYLVEQCDLQAPGDTAHFTPRDDDNEGGYTGLYLAMESYRYAATKDPRALENARKAFRAMKFLQEVTGTSGFFARTVVPSTWTKIHDGNETFPPEERADRLVRNPRDKPLENRWRRSADGQWLWKGDTSSDETTMHMFGYAVYYNLAADEAERATIRDHVRRIADHMLEGGFTFRDIDGQPTLWAVWSPEKLNGDADWRAERWLNGLEILAYLRTAADLTGDAKYTQAARELIAKHHYDRYARHPLATEPSERTGFDQELAGAVLTLAMTETDPAVRPIYEEGLAFWWEHVRMEDSPFFNFLWGSAAHPQSAAALNLDRVVDVLRDEPLDLVQWTIDSRKREDVRIVHEPLLDDTQVDRILPPSERATIRTDSNLYSAVRGEDGLSESSGVFWLMPYWMGRYLGYIGAPGVAVIAHRGEHLQHVENTLSAFQAAIDAGADYFECDVRSTSDGHMVLMHDDSVDRTTNGHGRVAELTFDQVRALDARGNRVPTFEEALELAKGRIGVYVDNKQTTPDALVRAIDHAGMGDHVVIYGGAELSAIRALRPDWKMMPEADDAARLKQAIASLNLTVAAFDDGDFKDGALALARQRGIGVFVDMLGERDDERHWQAAIDAGATGIQTDHPAELVRYLRSRGLHR